MEDLNKLELPEIKNLCKQYGISPIGDKKSLIKKLKYYLDPVEDVLNTHHGRKLPKGKKIVGVSVNKTEETNQVLKQKGQFMYYSLGYQYYMVTV
jgi:thiamine monophosphate synthase